MTEVKQKSLSGKPIFIVFAISFVLRLLYLFFIGPSVFGNDLLITNDSFSYTDSFVNLISNGEFTFDKNYGPASYGRLPAVSFIWGFFYLLVGKTHAYTAFALFQIVLDVFATYMISKIITKFFDERTALFVCIVYILFPLTLYFIVKTDYKYISLFLIIAVFYNLVFFKPGFRNNLSLALLLIIGFYTREILVLLIPLSFFYLARNYSLKFRDYVAIFLVMFVLYLPWPIRNYYKSGEIVLVKPYSAGYTEYREDIQSYMYWLYAWHNDDVQDYAVYVYDLKREVIFPEEIFGSETEKIVAINAVELARRCGSSFVIWQRTNEKRDEFYGKYDGLISKSFNLLANSYKSRHPIVYLVKVPFQNLMKAIFKNTLNDSTRAPAFIFKITMLLRTVVLLIGIFACFYFRRLDYFIISFLFSAGIYFFTCFIFRQVEMRYLYQADVIMLIVATVFVGEMINKKKEEKIN